MTLQEIKTKNMEETLFQKMYLEISLNKNDGNTVTAMACERVAIQAQIDAIKKIFKKYNENLRTTLTEGGFMQSLDSIALEEIIELEKQLS